VSPIYDGKGNVVGASKIARDVTERKRAEQERLELLQREKKARTDAENAVRQRDEFLSIAAHELRTPITSLRGFTQALLRQFERQGTVDNERLRQSLIRLDQQSVRLTKLTNQLLDISRIETGKLALEYTITDVAALINEVVAVEQSTTANHTLSLTAPIHLPAHLDAIRFEQVATNLIDNAIKYSPAGGPVKIELSEQDSFIRFAVTDRGIGIPVEHRPKIFERFFQAHENLSVSGMGLGLFISQHIVALHNGRLWAEFPDEGGTRFIVTLPCKPSS
jgi:signal transduction histidine kinase